MKKTVCIFSAQYLPHMGGVENYTFQLSKKLNEQGYRVIIVTSLDKGLKEYENSGNIEIYRMPSFQLLNGRFPILKINKSFSLIEKKLYNEKIDYVVINTRFYPLSVLGAKFAKKRGIEAIVIEHGSAYISFGNKLLDIFGNIYEHFMTFLIKRKCKNFYGVSLDSVKWLKKFKIQAKGTIHNAVNLEEIMTRLGNTKENFREKYSISQSSIVISFTGRLLSIKGLPNLVTAFQKIQKEYQNVYLFIAGDGELREFLLKQNICNVILLGKLKHDQVYDLLKNTDIFCLPSRSEGFSTSVLEAIACHCYIVTTNTGGANEMLLEGQCGEILNDGSVLSIYEGLKKAILLQDKRSELSEKAYTNLVENFTWNSSFKEMEKAFLSNEE